MLLHCIELALAGGRNPSRDPAFISVVVGAVGWVGAKLARGNFKGTIGKQNRIEQTRGEHRNARTVLSD